MSTLQRLLLAFAVVVAICVAPAVVMLINLNKLSDKVSFVATKPIAGVDNARAAWSAYRDLQASLANFLEMTRPQESKEVIAGFETQIKALDKHLNALGSSMGSTAASDKIKAVKASVADWSDKARVLMGAAPATSVAAPFTLARIEVAIRKNLDDLVTLALQDAAAVRADVEKSIENATELSVVFLLGGILAGITLALLSGLAISKPLVRLENTMRELASGNLDVEVSDKDRKDEIGRMAVALEVFRANAAEVRRLEMQGKESERMATDERRRLLSGVADRFKSQVSSIVTRLFDTVSVVESSAERMAHVADETRGHIDQVVGASESASGNIASVAAAAEEMSATSGEISERSGQSHSVASSAVVTVEIVEQGDRLADRVDRQDRRDRRSHPRHRGADQSPGAQRNHRSGARGRVRARLLGCRLRGENARRPDQQGDRRNLDPDRSCARDHQTGRGGHQCDPADHRHHRQLGRRSSEGDRRPALRYQ